MEHNPHMLVKVRSKALKDACAHMPCTLRLASIVGKACAHQTTVVGCHLPVAGHGVNTKVSDINLGAGCSVCHGMLDGNSDGLKAAELYPAVFWDRVLNSFAETLARFVEKDLIVVPGAKLIGK